MTKIIDGKAIAQDLLSNLKLEVEAFTKTSNITPNLVIILVGDDPASHIYVNSKQKKAEQVGIESRNIKLPESISEQELMEVIDGLNSDDSVHAILLQLPLPDHLDAARIIDFIAPEKDVDGFHSQNLGKLMIGNIGYSSQKITQSSESFVGKYKNDLPADSTDSKLIHNSGIIPCTPKGCLKLIKTVRDDLSGLKSLVIGRSRIVGLPMSSLLLHQNTTITTAHIHTKNLAEECKNADIIVSATGVPHLIKGDWIKEGAIVIDVGINRVEQNGESKIVGDVDTEVVKKRASAAAITPVPGGVGPMTIACLLENTLYLAWLRNERVNQIKN